MEYSHIHQKTIEELGEMAKQCNTMIELNKVMTKANKEV
jgi:hypothetical protein